MAKSLSLQIHRPSTEPAKHLYEPKSKDTTTPVHILMLTSLLSTAQLSWTKPASFHTMSKRIDNLYRVYDPGALVLQKQPSSNSIFVKASQSRSQNRQTLIPPNKDSRRIDSMGRWLYSSAAFTMRVANYQGAMGAYQPFLWDNMSVFIKSLPEDKNSTCPYLSTVRSFHCQTTDVFC